MANMGQTVIIEYCTVVIWHGLHGAHYSHHMMVWDPTVHCNLFLGSADTHTQSHTVSQSVSHTEYGNKTNGQQNSIETISNRKTSDKYVLSIN